MNIKLHAAAWAVALSGLMPCAAWAQVTVVDDFTQGSATVNWVPFNGACLTAGNGSGTVPACVGLPYYTEQLVGGTSGLLPDQPGQGALRFTNGYPGGYHQNGAIILSPTNAFPSNAGVQITFTTVTYRGDSGGAGGDGADGISFFLMDARTAPNFGAFGGSLGYTCSNTNNDPTLYANGDNTASGYGYQPGRIGMRGAGNVAWRWLNANYPVQYPTSLTIAQRASAVQLTCSTGVLWDYSGGAANPVVSATQPPANQPLDSDGRADCE